jgi:tetratricopeptide (TPR) repeat protein
VSGHADEHEEQEIAALRARIERDPTDLAAMVRLGAMMFEPCHSPEDAVRLLGRAIELDRRNVDARFWLAACLFHEYVDVRGASQLLEEALTLAPDRPDCLSLMASVAADQGKPPADYVQYLEKAVERAPDWMLPREQLVRALLALGRHDEAEAQANQALASARGFVESTGSLEKYYEAAVTGRASTTVRDRLSRLLTDIRRAKTRRALYGTFPRSQLP